MLIPRELRESEAVRNVDTPRYCRAPELRIRDQLTATEEGAKDFDRARHARSRREEEGREPRGDLR